VVWYPRHLTSKYPFEIFPGNEYFPNSSVNVDAREAPAVSVFKLTIAPVTGDLIVLSNTSPLIG
jgi:hypothetical protein